MQQKTDDLRIFINIKYRHNPLSKIYFKIYSYTPALIPLREKTMAD